MIKAQVLEVTTPKEFEVEGKRFKYRHILFDIGEGKLLRADLWGDRPAPEVGTTLRIDVEVTSERNRKDPNLFFHKVKLKHYEDYDKPLWKEDPVAERVRDEW
jgi:hypothetical protein